MFVPQDYELALLLQQQFNEERDSEIAEEEYVIGILAPTQSSYLFLFVSWQKLTCAN